MTIFGRPLADMTPANANCARAYLAELDDCPDCAAYRQRFAELGLEFECVNTACPRTPKN